MSDKAEPKNNYDRLLTYLEEGSLADQLVRAHRDYDAAHSVESMKAILRERLKQVRAGIDNPKD